MAAIQKQLKTFSFVDEFDNLAGKSTGSLICGLLTVPILESFHQQNKENISLPGFPIDILNIYLDNCKQIFASRSSPFSLYHSKYSSKFLEKLAEFYFGNIKLNELRKPILIPAIKEVKSPDGKVYFENVYFKTKNSENITLKDAVLASSSAPTYFDPYRIENELYRDGGILHNNPAYLLFNEMTESYKEENQENLIICSIGTGFLRKDPAENELLYWGKIGLDSSITMSMTMKDVDNNLNAKLKGNYF